MTRTYPSNPDHGVVGKVIEFYQIPLAISQQPDPANKRLKIGDVVGIACPITRDYLSETYFVKSYIGTISEVVDDNRYVVELESKFDVKIFCDVDLEDLTIK